MKTSKERNKAWLGAVIGAVASIAGSLLSGSLSKNAQDKEQRRQQIAQNRADTLQMAQNLTAGYGDQSYVDDLTRRVTFKCGGRKRIKAESGGNFDWGSVINGASSGINNVITAMIAANNMRNSHVDSRESFANTPKTEVVMPDYVNNIDYQNRLTSMLRCGGRKRCR